MAAAALKHPERPCPICGEGEAELLHHQSFLLPAESPLPDQYDVVSCTRCAFVYADTLATQADYDRHYALHSKYEDPSVATGGGDSPLDRLRLEDTAATLAKHLKPFGKDARILDVGCANGGLLTALRRAGFTRLYGVDPSPGCVAQLRTLQIEGSCGKLSDLRSLAALAARDPFEAIVLSHVMEHVLAVDAAMAALKPLLAPEGFLYVEVPDAARYADHPFVPFYYFDSEHINHFSAASLRNLAAIHGFRVDDCEARDIAVPDARRYPAVWAVLTAANESSPPVPDHLLRECVIEYVGQSGRAAYPTLEKLACAGRPVLLWGAGSHAQRLLLTSPLARCVIAAVVDQDRNKHGLIFAGCTVRAPESLTDAPAEFAIVVTSVLHAPEIERRIRTLGLQNPVVVADGSNEKP